MLKLSLFSNFANNFAYCNFFIVFKFSAAAVFKKHRFFSCFLHRRSEKKVLGLCVCLFNSKQSKKEIPFANLHKEREDAFLKLSSMGGGIRFMSCCVCARRRKKIYK